MNVRSEDVSRAKLMIKEDKSPGEDKDRIVNNPKNNPDKNGQRKNCLIPNFKKKYWVDDPYESDRALYYFVQRFDGGMTRDQFFERNPYAYVLVYVDLK